jgi:hypothetical protein
LKLRTWIRREEGEKEERGEEGQDDNGRRSGGGAGGGGYLKKIYQRIPETRKAPTPLVHEQLSKLRPDKEGGRREGEERARWTIGRRRIF